MNKILFTTIFLCFTSLAAWCQDLDRCGTMTLLQNRILKNPSLKIMMQERDRLMQLKMAERSSTAIIGREAQYTIPVVFHIVLNNPDLVTDAQIQAQLDTLNKDYGGLNG